MENSFLLSMKHSINAINDVLTYCYCLTKAKFSWFAVFCLLLNSLRTLPLFWDVMIIIYCAMWFSFFVDMYIKIECIHSILFAQLNGSKQMVCCSNHNFCGAKVKPNRDKTSSAYARGFSPVFGGQADFEWEYCEQFIAGDEPSQRRMQGLRNSIDVTKWEINQAAVRYRYIRSHEAVHNFLWI
ncbi:phage polarity suppression protein [Citrobacter sp. Igbk 14]|uniref:phage polarity suppression protein n=1 Tax=Citrobacter sp. Igbk 14 TaxID=2963960 RepID=UPI003FA445F2